MAMGEWEALEAVSLPTNAAQTPALERSESDQPMARGRLADQVAVITGGNGGLGLATAVQFAREGAHLVLAARSAESLGRAAEDLRVHGIETLAVPTDVGDPEQVERLFERARHAFGQVDILVNNAGVSGPTAPLHEISVHDWEHTLSVDLTSAFLCAKAALPGMIARGRGNILNVSSIFGKRAYPFRTPYAAAKWALIGLTQSLAQEVGRHGIRVNAICPGPIAGERIERVWQERSHRRGIPLEAIRDKMVRMAALRRIPEAEEFAELALFLCSDASRGMTGQALNISAGMEMR